MKGWLKIREGKFSIQKSCYYFRLQWGFLTQHPTEHSAATCKYLIHEARINTVQSQLKIMIELGPLARSHVCDLRGLMLSSITLVAVDYRTFLEWSECLFRARNRRIQNCYTIGQILGQGSEGTVFMGVNKEHGGTKVAIKQIPLADPETSERIGHRLQRIFRQIQLQHKVAKSSENVANILDVFYDNTACFVIMELGNCGALTDMLEERENPLSEEQTRNIVLQLGRCLLTLHQSNVVHRDVKCDNVLLCKRKDGTVKVMLSDFGFASVWRSEREDNVRSFCRKMIGTMAYLAPEILRREKYGTPCDIFALGVLCYVCLTGVFPYCENNPPAYGKGLMELGMRDMSEDARSFCRGLLQVDARKRLSAVGLLQHSWIRRNQNRWEGERRRLEVCGSRGVLRRAVYVIITVIEMRRLGKEVGGRKKVGKTVVSAHRPQYVMSPKVFS